MDITDQMRSKLNYLLFNSGALETLAEDASLSVSEAEAACRHLLDDGTVFGLSVDYINGRVRISTNAEVGGPDSGWFIASNALSFCDHGLDVGRASVVKCLIEEARIGEWEWAVRRAARKKALGPRA